MVAGYIKLLDPRVDGNRFIRLILGRGGLFGDRPFGAGAFRGFLSPQCEQAVAHGPAEVIEMDRRALEAAAHAQAGLATLLASARSSEKDLFCCYAYGDRAAARGCQQEGVPPVVEMGDSPGHFHAAPGWYPVACSRINGGTINALRRHPAARTQRDGGPALIGPMRPDPWAGPGGRGPRPLD